MHRTHVQAEMTGGKMKKSWRNTQSYVWIEHWHRAKNRKTHTFTSFVVFHSPVSTAFGFDATVLVLCSVQECISNKKCFCFFPYLYFFACALKLYFSLGSFSLSFLCPLAIYCGYVLISYSTHTLTQNIAQFVAHTITPSRIQCDRLKQIKFSKFLWFTC